MSFKGKALSLTALGDRLETIRMAIDETLAFPGEIWECGAFQGGGALWMKSHLMEMGSVKTLRLFDTFAGMPNSSPSMDFHKEGTMASSYEEVAALFEGLADCHIYRGIMPATFLGLEHSLISVAHIDVDQYLSVKECLEWVYPRVHSGGYIILDDYNCGACPGAKIATDNFLLYKPERLVIKGHPNPQAYFIKL